MSDDQSPGDSRQPYSDVGGPAQRHAKTHDVRREAHTNPRGPEPGDPSFAAQMAPIESGPGGGHAAESTPGDADKVLHETLRDLTNDELARLAVLEPGTRLEQGGVYIDLNRLGDGPFQAIGGHEASRANRLISKRDTDYELWNLLAGNDANPEIERPAQAD
jgi:hypothetical protein